MACFAARIASRRDGAYLALCSATSGHRRTEDPGTLDSTTKRSSSISMMADTGPRESSRPSIERARERARRISRRVFLALTSSKRESCSARSARRSSRYRRWLHWRPLAIAGDAAVIRSPKTARATSPVYAGKRALNSARSSRASSVSATKGAAGNRPVPGRGGVPRKEGRGRWLARTDQAAGPTAGGRRAARLAARGSGRRQTRGERGPIGARAHRRLNRLEA